MKSHKLFLAGLLLIASLFTALASTPDKNDFNTLNKVYSAAAKSLNKVENGSQLPAALTQLKKIQIRNADKKEVRAVLNLTPVSCPPQLISQYRESLRLQAELKDAGKRLAMAGILQGGPHGAAYKQFCDAFKLTEELQDNQPEHEGAPFETPEARNERMKWWREGKFGMFVHYGLYSGLAGEVQGKNYAGCVEWILMQSGLDSDTYAKEALPKFNPKAGKATEWVKLAKESGCKYIVVTSRHHEGYNMYNTKHSDFNVYKTKGIDILDEYSKACDQYNLKAGYYFSLLDWSHPDYDPTGSGISYPKGNYDAQKEGKRQFGNHERYKEYMFNIFDELTSNYRVDLVWWDFSQPRFQGDKAWGATRLMSTLFEKNPKAIQNNRLYHSENHLSEGGIRVTPTWKGDYSTAEHHIPSTGIDGDWEACQTLNGTWGYSAENQRWKTSETLIHELIDAVSRGGNYLLNIGPEPDGSIPAQSIRLFKEIGAWMHTNGEAIYETTANPFPVEFEWGRVTKKSNDTLYLLVYNKPENGLIELPCSFAGNVSISILGCNETVQLTQQNGKTSIDIQKITLNPGATVIKLRGKRQ